MDRRTADQLTDVLARVLHYQERKDEPDPMTAPYAEVRKEYTEMPPRIVERYRNNAVFRAQVQRALHMVLEVLETTPQSERDRINALALECAQASSVVRRSGDV